MNQNGNQNKSIQIDAIEGRGGSEGRLNQLSNTKNMDMYI